MDKKNIIRYIENGFFILVAFILLFSYIKKNMRKPWSDFDAYYMAGKRIISKVVNEDLSHTLKLNPNKIVTQNDSLYWDNEIRPFKYPPHIAIYSVPFSFGTYRGGSVSWLIWHMLLLLTVLYVFYKTWLIPNFSSRKSRWILFALVVLTIKFIADDWSKNQINVSSLCFFTLGCFYYYKKPKLSTFFIFMASSIKIFPLIAVLFYVGERQWKRIGHFTLYGIGSILLCTVIYGPTEFYQECLRFIAFMTNSQHQFPAPAKYLYTSIPSMFVRLLMDREVYPGTTLNIANISAQAVGAISYLFCLICIVFIYRSHRRSILNNTDKVLRAWVYIGVYYSFSQLISPLGWKHTFVALLMPQFFLLMFFFTQKNLKYLIWFWISEFCFNFASKDVVGKKMQRLLMGLSLGPIGTLIMLFLTIKVTDKLDIKHSN